ncbi:MAG: helix-turn-helix domain-containing protein, partial [Pseudomonadota bacterium]
EWMVLLGRKTAREKISSLLAIIARRQERLAGSTDQGRIVFDLQLTRETMADYLGLTIETVSRQMTALRKDGVIELEGTRTIKVPDYARLLDEAGYDNDGAPLS